MNPDECNHGDPDDVYCGRNALEYIAEPGRHRRTSDLRDAFYFFRCDGGLNGRWTAALAAVAGVFGVLILADLHWHWVVYLLAALAGIFLVAEFLVAYSLTLAFKSAAADPDRLDAWDLSDDPEDSVL